MLTLFFSFLLLWSTDVPISNKTSTTTLLDLWEQIDHLILTPFYLPTKGPYIHYVYTLLSGCYRYDKVSMNALNEPLLIYLRIHSILSLNHLFPAFVLISTMSATIWKNFTTQQRKSFLYCIVIILESHSNCIFIFRVISPYLALFLCVSSLCMKS